MRVAYLASQYPASSHTFIRREIEVLRRRGIDIETFSIRVPSSGERVHPRDQEAYDTTTYVLPMKLARLMRAHVRSAVRRPLQYLGTLSSALKHRVPGSRAFLWSLFYFAEAVVLAADLEDAGVEHLHNHFANPGANVGYLASKYLGVGWSLTLHGLSDFDYPAGVLLPEKIKHARFVACVSHYGKALAFLYLDPRYWEKLFVTRCGLDPADFPGRKPRAPRTRLRVVSVGRLSPEKGQLGLLEAFAGVVKRGIDAELRIVGEGPLRPLLEQRIAELGLEGRCLLLGRKAESEIAPELAEADVFAFASFMEGLPVSLMEALAMELAVVAPSVAGIPELIEHDRTGLLFPASDWKKLEEQLAALLGDEALRQRLGREGRRKVMAEFALETAVDPLFRHLSELGR